MSTAGVSSLTSSEGTDFYMQLLITQLQNQDPMEPLSNTDMVTQMAQLSTVEALDNLSAGFSEMLKLQQLLGGAELLGRQIEYTDGNTVVSGVVDSAHTSDGQIILGVGDREVSLDQVERIL